MAIKPMTSKDLHIACKRADGISYLMNRFSIETEEELFAVIRRVVAAHSDWFIKKLQKCRAKAKDNFSVETDSQICDVDWEVVAEDDGEISEPDPEHDELEEAKDVKRKEVQMKLNDLLKEEEELSTSLRFLEGVHKEMVAKRRSIVSDLEAEKAVLIRLQSELSEHENAVMALYTEYKACAEKMQDINGDMRAHTELLKELRDEIAELQKITVFVYDTGIIEVENAEVPLIPEERIREEVDRIISLPEAEEVTIRNVKIVARLKAMLAELQSDNVEIIFDSEKVQALYSA